jgi:methionyl-tRNA formyltransferase
MKILLATHGSQGVVALRELFALGYNTKNVTVLLSSGKNGPIIEFLKFNKMNVQIISSGMVFDECIRLMDVENALLISVSWAYKFSEYAIKVFNKRMINFHPGLLPKYKGCYSTSWSLINKESYVGYTYHFINSKFDEGNIILKNKIRVQDNDTAHSLHYKIFQQGLRRMGDAILLINTVGKKQNGKGNYYPNQLPYNGVIDPKWSADEIKIFVRAIYFPPFEPAIIMKD